ncbi:hypothetical protein CYMTET_48071 [Cymbomonas tetramitiformis]|uniref:NACHT domain-containing protein n=1 Tax=Cymbomonas tetramitiformis TaxID=36881 RepID=A0AAE0EX40_9CHLO|nr:hypothetical protein CYMTET_48071 [Cymbomonas tetramitiformis]
MLQRRRNAHPSSLLAVSCGRVLRAGRNRSRKVAFRNFCTSLPAWVCSHGSSVSSTERVASATSGRAGGGRRFKVNFRKLCSSLQAGRGKASKGSGEVGMREREKNGTEEDEASEERLPGEAEKRVQEEPDFRGQSMWDLGISAKAVEQLRLHVESFFVQQDRPLAAVSIEDVVVEFVLERTRSSQCRLIELVQYVDGSEVGTPTHFVRPMKWNSPFVIVLEMIERALADAEEAEAYVWLDFLAVNHHTTTEQHEVMDYAGLSEYESKAKMGTIVEIPPPATVFKGLSLAALRGLGETLRAQFGERWSTVTTEEVVQEFVLPETETRQCRLVDLPEYVAAESVGRPSYFISHAWKGAFATLLNRVLNFLVSASDETRVWVDVFAVNQHREPLHQQNRQDVMAFKDVVEHCVGTIVVVDIARMNPAMRAWCVYEWDATIWHHGSDALQMLMSEEDRVEIVSSIDIEEAQCFHPGDKAMILQRVREHHGDAATFNHMLKTSLLLAPLSYRADQRRHRQRSAGTAWEWGAVEAWLDGPHRALGVLAGAGTGKSTICTMLMDYLAAERPRLVVAAHFLKYSDQRRLDPVLAIRSLAHQLASRSAAFRDRLFALDPAHVTALVDPERAFRDLLQAPLSQVREPVLILLDALDEADPPEQYLPGFSRNVKACGNKTLQLLTRQLVQLGANVRFVITTRPDAVCSQIEPLLGRVFADNVTLLRPEALRSEAAAEHGAQGTGVLVYHTVAKECAALGDSWGKDHADLSDVYSAYRRVFVSALAEQSPKDREGVLALLEVLLAAQEPLAESSLQRMGLAGALPRLPGWGCLFYVAEHHVYLLHKSLSDWLLQESQAEGAAVRALEVARGHERLGAFLSRHRASPLAYCLKYLLFHLASSRLPDGARRQLDEALLDWSFLVRVVRSRNAGRAAQAIGSIPQSAHSEVSYDMLRWLRLAMHELEENPCLDHFVATAWGTAPLGSVPHMKAAEHTARRGWECVEGHTGKVTGVAFSVGGTHLATASVDRTARVWSVSSGECTTTMKGHINRVTGVAFSAHGTHLATASWDGTARVWSLLSGECTTAMQGHTHWVEGVAFSPDGTQVATASMDSTARVWSLLSGTQAGYRVASARTARTDHGQLGQDGSRVGESRTATMQGHTHEVTGVAFSVDGAHLATASWDKTAGV